MLAHTSSSSDRYWRSLSAILILLALLFSCAHYSRFPLFLDSYYHMAVVRAFDTAGGVPLWGFWEFAPEGRPHLYPPLFHLGVIALNKSGIPLVEVFRILGVLSFPLLLFCLAFVLEHSLSPRHAFFGILVSSAPYTLYLVSSYTLPFTLATAFCWLSYAALQRRGFLAAGAWLSLACYTHTGAAVMGGLALLLYGLMNSEIRAAAWKSVCLGALLGFPWWSYVLQHHDSLEPVRRMESSLIEWVPLCLILGGAGVLWGIRQRRARSAYWLCWLTAQGLFLVHYPYRFWSAQGLLALAILGGLVLEAWTRKYEGSWGIKQALGLWLILQLFCPSYLNGWGLCESNLGAAIGLSRLERTNDVSLYNRDLADALSRAVLQNTGEGDLIWCDSGAVAALLSALTGRASSTGMWEEVLPGMPRTPIERLQLARCALLLKDAGLPVPFVNRAQWKPVAETDLATVWIQDEGTVENPQGPVIPIAVCLGFLIGLLVLTRFKCNCKLG
ncbi:MAG: hypothetical protein JW937_03770 [Candidatus Omnitrophica bacterium]|nr:hypothetical protein [Candidatus Omnitrophota bacterium]